MKYDNSGNRFLDLARKRAKQNNFNPKELTVSQVDLSNEQKDFEIYLFTNFDICNFTKYKREHKDWINLLSTFLSKGINQKMTEWPMQFWKFNGDSLTYRKRIQSVDEICEFLRATQIQLDQLQTLINKNNVTGKLVYIKASIWIAGFDPKFSSKNVDSTNNVRFSKTNFGQEFVGENIDEGFRLSSCSKAGIVVVDPKIVYILNFWNKIVYDQPFNGDIFIRKKQEYTSLKEIQATKQIANKIKDTVNSLFLMEFQKCKGVWDDRDYPIFWYINDIDNKSFIYDEIVGNCRLCDHLVCRNLQDFKNKANAQREQLMQICSQVGILQTLTPLIERLIFSPLTEISGESIYDTANLYYMIACVLTQKGEHKGVLIFKRSSHRVHLKDVWDLVPVKYSRVKARSDGAKSGILMQEYLKEGLLKALGVSNENSNSSKYDWKNMISICSDHKRNSIKPFSLCNIYRNGEIHNGVLCMAEIDITGHSINEILKELTHQLNPMLYTDVKLITKENIILDESCSNMFDSKETHDYITIDNLKIRSLTLSEVSDDSDRVFDNPQSLSNFENRADENAFGISFLAYSIDQILTD